MASKSNRHANGKRPSKFDGLTDEIIQQRWMSLRPKAMTGLGISLLLMVVSYLVLHFAYPIQGDHPKAAFLGVEYIVTLVFQISCVIGACAGLLTAMSLIYGRASGKGQAGH